MITLQEAAQRALSDDQIDLIAADGMRNAAGGIYATRVNDFARAVFAAALASEPQACRSVSGKCERQGGLSSIHEPQAEPVEQPGAVGLSERRAYEAWAEANWDLKGADPFSLVGELFPAFQAGRASIASAQPAAPGWLPIETAPLNVPILVGPTKRMGICVAEHHSRDGWVTETCSEWVPIYAPTHWQPLPLPPPPAATQGAKTP